MCDEHVARDVQQIAIGGRPERDGGHVLNASRQGDVYPGCASVRGRSELVRRGSPSDLGVQEAQEPAVLGFVGAIVSDGLPGMPAIRAHADVSPVSAGPGKLFVYNLQAVAAQRGVVRLGPGLTSVNGVVNLASRPRRDAKVLVEKPGHVRRLIVFDLSLEYDLPGTIVFCLGWGRGGGWCRRGGGRCLHGSGRCRWGTACQQHNQERHNRQSS